MATRSATSPPDAAWLLGGYLPSVSELARHLAERFDYPRDETLDLVRVSEYAYVMSGSGPLYEERRASTRLSTGEYGPVTGTRAYFAIPTSKGG
jgi:hypothetical protein